MSHFDKDYREKALTWAAEMEEYNRRCPSLTDDEAKAHAISAIAKLLHDAHLAGRREGSADGYRRGIEEAAKVSDVRSKFRDRAGVGRVAVAKEACMISKLIRALLEGGNT